MKRQIYLLLFAAPPPRSRAIVELLAGLPIVGEAAAVYTEVDVVARVTATEAELADVLTAVRRSVPSAMVTATVKVDEVLPGISQKKGRFQGHSSVLAFTRCRINTSEANFAFVVGRLLRIKEVRYVYPVEGDSEVIVQVVAPDKISLDRVVMESIQDAAGTVDHTRTYITINEMHWAADGAPRTREEFMGGTRRYPVFMAVAEGDRAFAEKLVDQIYSDTQIRIWHYGLNKTSGDYQASIDKSMGGAESFLLLISSHFLGSRVCQGEFGKICGLAKPDQICCLVLPGCDIGSLDIEYRRRQLVDGNRFFAYTQLLEWLRDTVSAEPFSV